MAGSLGVLILISPLYVPFDLSHIFKVQILNWTAMQSNQAAKVNGIAKTP